MLKPALLVCPLATALPQLDCHYIGVDLGAYILAKNNIMMELAIGDFDSCDTKQYEIIEKKSIKLNRLPVAKDESDLESAIKKAKEMGYKTIYITGALGSRFDHQYVNLQLLIQEKNVKIIFLDPTNRLETFKRGKHEIAKKNYKYISFFAIEDSVISLHGFKYPLKNRLITKKDIYTVSNEIIDEVGILEVHQGKVLVVQASDSKERS